MPSGFVRFAVILTLGLFPLLGCGSSKVGMSGKVVYSDDKSPLTTGWVCFESDSHVARGQLNQNGEYRLGTNSAKDGLPPGHYRVYISGASIEEAPTAAQAAQGALSIPRLLIQTKYDSGATSEITVDVNASTRTFSFEVDRYTK